MRHRDCPACGHVVGGTGLRVEPSSLWPRYRCPRCGVQLRSSNRSLLPAFVLFILGLAGLLSDGFLPASIAAPARMLGSAALLGSILCAYWFHKWEVAGDRRD